MIHENTPPGIAKNTLCVAAAKAFPDQMERGSGVSGPTSDKRRKPDLMAVGCGIRSAKVGTLCDTDLYENIDPSAAACHEALRLRMRQPRLRSCASTSWRGGTPTARSSRMMQLGRAKRENPDSRPQVR